MAGSSWILHLILHQVTQWTIVCLLSVTATCSPCTVCYGTTRKELANTFPVTGKTASKYSKEVILVSRHTRFFLFFYCFHSKCKRVLNMEKYVMSKYWYKCFNQTLNHRDHKAVGRRPFDKMATLLAYLGPPEHKPVADTHWSSLNLTSSKFEEFMTRWLFLLLPKARVSLLFGFYPEIARVKFVIKA